MQICQSDTAPLATCQISNRWVISGKSSRMYFAICLCLSVTSVPMRSAPTVEAAGQAFFLTVVA